MKLLCALILCLFLSLSISSQVINNGTIIIHESASLAIAKDMMNNATGTIENSGHLEVKGTFVTELGSVFHTSSSATCDIKSEVPGSALKKPQNLKTKPQKYIKVKSKRQ